MNPRIAFLSGLPGTGKSTLVRLFETDPVQGWHIYDFDKGKFPCPADQAEHFEWRLRQTAYWLDLALKNVPAGTAVLGLAPYPSDILRLAAERDIPGESVRLGLLTCGPEERMSRLIDRGTPHHWQGHRPWYDEFYDVMRKANAREFDTTDESADTTAQKIRSWLEA